MARVYLEDIPKNRFTENTLRRMYELVDAGKTDERFQKLVYGIVNRSMPGQWKDYRREISVIFDWFKRNHDYRRDPYDVELLQDIWATLDRKRFDCDDSSIWLSSACEVLGAPSRFVTVSTRQDKEPVHVYSQCFVGGRWVTLDATVPGAQLGWEPQVGITARKIWSRSDVGLATYDPLDSIEGLSMINNGHTQSWEGGFASNMFQPPTPNGIPSDVSKTWAHGEPGEIYQSKRRIPSKEVHIPADQRRIERAGDGVYPREYPIEAHRDPGELWHTIDRKYIPQDFNMFAWSNPVPDLGPDPSYMLPQMVMPESGRLVDVAGLAGLGAISQDAGNIASTVSSLVATGEIPPTQSAIQSAINVAVDVWAAKQQAKLTSAQVDLARAEAQKAAAQAEIARQAALAEEGVPFYKKPWFFPVVGAAAVFLFRGGAALFERRRSRKT